MAQKRLMQELQPLQKEKWVHIEVRLEFANREELPINIVLPKDR
jgi:hypothetical protein